MGLTVRPVVTWPLVMTRLLVCLFFSQVSAAGTGRQAEHAGAGAQEIHGNQRYVLVCAHTHTHTHVQQAKDATDVFASDCVFQCVSFLPRFRLRLAEADSRPSRFIDLLISLFVFFFRARNGQELNCSLSRANRLDLNPPGSSLCRSKKRVSVVFVPGRQDLRAAGRRRADPPAAHRGGGHEGLLGAVPGGEAAEGDKRGAGGLLHEGGQAALQDGGSGSLGVRLSGADPYVSTVCETGQTFEKPKMRPPLSATRRKSSGL